jgi:hypothetical protein
MPQKFEPIDLSRVKTYPLSKRKSKVSAGDFAGVWQKGAGFKEFLKRLPDILAGNEIRTVISCTADAFRQGNSIVFAMGAHVIKVGLTPIIVDLMERGMITAVALNGAGIIHDLELAMAGATSEDVSASIRDGAFGMARETGAFLCDAIRRAKDTRQGLGKIIGAAMVEKKLPYLQHSILAAGSRLNIPVTVHVAFGTDIIHMHPEFDAKATGEATYSDFRIFASVVSTLEGGVYFNIGSAVILPEVFLKAVTLARNLGHRLNHFTTVNMDFIRHYRPMTNVVCRPTADGGRGFHLTGHHEIMLPLIAAGLIEEFE